MLEEFEMKREALFLETKASRNYPQFSDEQLMMGLSATLYSTLGPADKLLFRRELVPTSAEFQEVVTTANEFENLRREHFAANRPPAERPATAPAEPIPPADPLRESNARAIASLERMAASSAASLQAFQGNPMCTPMGWPAWAPPFGQSQAPQTPSAAAPQRPQPRSQPQPRPRLQPPFSSTAWQERATSTRPQFQAPPLAPFQFQAPPLAPFQFQAPPVVPFQFQAPPVAPFQIQRPPQAAVQSSPAPVSTSNSSSCCYNPCAKLGPYAKLGAGVATVAGLTVGGYVLAKHLTAL